VGSLLIPPFFNYSILIPIQVSGLAHHPLHPYRTAALPMDGMFTQQYTYGGREAPLCAAKEKL